MRLINWEMLREPYNWAILILFTLIGGAILALVAPEPPPPDTTTTPLGA